MSVLAKEAVTFSEHDTSISLFNFAEASIPSQFSFENIEAKIVSSGDGITAGKHALKIHTHSKENFHTSIVLEPSDGEVWNWSLLPAFSFAFDATNVGQRSTQLFINLFDHKGQMHSRCANIPSQTSDTYLVELRESFLKEKRTLILAYVPTQPLLIPRLPTPLGCGV